MTDVTVTVTSRESDDDGDTLYPDRRTCLRCDEHLGYLVIRRRFCGYECAGMTPPEADPAARPRGCRRPGGAAKRAYRWPGEVLGADESVNGAFHVYECGHCGTYHLGHVHRDRGVATVAEGVSDGD